MRVSSGSSNARSGCAGTCSCIFRNVVHLLYVCIVVWLEHTALPYDAQHQQLVSILAGCDCTASAVTALLLL